MNQFRQMLRPGMQVEDSDGNPVGTVDQLQGEWFVLRRPDGRRLQVWYDVVQNLLGNTVVLSIPEQQLVGRAAQA